MHGQWINETDFSNYPFSEVESISDPNVRQQAYSQIDKTEESREKYNEFIDLYIKLYYEPINPDFEDIMYFTRDSDKKLSKLIGNKKVKGIYIK